MATYQIKGPDGSTYDLDGPDDASDEDVINALLNSEEYNTSPGVTQSRTEQQAANKDILVPAGSTLPEVAAQPTGKEGYGDVYSRRLEEARDQRPGLDDDNRLGAAFESGTIGDTGIPNPLRVVNDIAELGARGFEQASAIGNTALEGLDDLSLALSPGKIANQIFGTKDYSEGNEVRLGSMAGALQEAFPAGGLETGIGGTAIRGALDRNALAKESNEAFRGGATFDQMNEWATSRGLNPFGDDLRTAILERDKNKTLAVIADMEKSKENFENKRANPENETPLEKQAREFVAKGEPEVKDLFLVFDEEAATAKLVNEANEFVDSRKVPEEDFFPDLKSRAELDAEAQAKANPEPVVGKADEVVDQVNDIIKDWKDSPEFAVHDTFDNLEGVDPDAIGAVLPDGSVVINASKIDSPETMKAVVYHEALGHNGMSKAFGQTLDKTLGDFYNTNENFRASVDKWVKENSSAYDGNIVRAADEVLAEMSEKGVIDPTLMNRIKNKIKQIARKMGMKMDFSDREIETILGMAHQSVINGRSVLDNGFAISPRYMRDRKKTLSPDSMETQNDVSDLLEFTAKSIEGQSPSYSIPEIKRMADNMGLNASKYINQKGFTEQQLAARLMAANQLFTNLSDELAGLGERLRTEGYSPLLHAQIREKLAKQEAVAARLDGDSAEAGRAVRILREVVQAKRSAEATARYMAKHGKDDVLSNPESLAKFMEQYNQIGANSGVEAKIDFLRKTRKHGVVSDLLNVPRTLMSSFDLSAPFRQGVFLIGRKEFWKAMPDMLKSFASEGAYDAVMADIRTRPTYPLMVKGKLGIVDDSADLSMREDAFLSKTAGRLPGVKHSQQAYNAFLNKLRADVFDDLVKKSADVGLNLADDPKALRDTASFINNATGRGELGKFEQSIPVLTAMFFSPRLIASRLTLLNPRYYAKLSPVVQREAIKSLMSFGAIATTVVSLAKMGGADVSGDPLSSDFGKLKFGNTRYDIFAGFSQYVTLGSRLWMNEKTNMKGETKELGEGYGAKTGGDTLVDFARNKLAPVPSYIADYLYGKDPVGNDFDLTSSTAKRFIPLLAQGVYDEYKQSGDLGTAAAKNIPGIFGVGVATYGDEVRAPSSFSHNKETIKLTKDQKEQWATLQNAYIKQGMENTEGTEEYQNADEAGKAEIEKEIRSEAYQLTKQQIFPELSEGE